MNTKRNISILLLLIVALFSWAREGAPPTGYYSSIDGKSGSTLKSTLGSLTRARLTTLLDYGSGSGKTWQGLYYTDRDESDNSVIDMYSFNKRYFDTSNPTASVTNCDIEHMFANSWFGAKSGCKEAYCDLHHLVPSDYSANRSKSNHGPGMVVDTTFNNGLWVNGKTSANIPVFCPPDEYKGDFARAFFYIAATYGDTVTWQSEGTDNNFMTNDDWKEFQPATYNLLLTWHRQDPVSEKELKRMNEVYKIQGNRNPFIDYPCLAEYIWGTYSGQTVSLSALTCAYDDNFSGDGCVTVTSPTITSPTGTVNVGTTSQNTSITKTVTVKGINLTTTTPNTLNLSLSGTNASLFSLSTTTVSKANATSGYNLTITYTPTANGNHTATLTISGCGVTSHTVQLTGTCAAVYTATWMVDGLQHAQTTAASGQTPAIPDAPHDCSATRVFMGWTAQSSISARPSDLFTDEVAALTSNKTYYAVFADMSAGSSGSVTYAFSSKSWEATPANWTSGKDGYGFANNGVTVSSSVSGANATCPTSYNNIEKVTVTYCTLNNSSAGTITITIGDNELTQNVSNAGVKVNNDLEFSFSTSHPSGAPKITVTCTTNTLYIVGIKIDYGEVTYDNYSLTCGSTGVDVTATFLSQGISYAMREGHSGETISAVTAPSSCAAYSFYNWSTHTYATHNTSAPTIDYTGTYPTADITYNAIYSKTVTGTIAPVGTVMWAESFTSYSANNVPSGSENSTTNGRQVYNGGAVTYTCVDGASTTSVQTGTFAGGVTPELMLPSGNGSFTVSNIPTGGADSLTLSFLANGVKSYLNVSSPTSGVNVGTLTKEGSNVTVDIKTSGVNTFALTITDIAGSNYVRADNFYLAVKKAGSSAGADITYYTTSPECNLPNTVTVTFHSNDGTNSTATQSIYENIATALRANSFVRPHYTFLGWSTSSSATTATYTDKHEVTLNANLVLYAVWENSPTYTVTYINNGGQYAQVIDYPGETITGVGTPTLNNCEGHTFLGWTPNTYALKNTETPELASLTTVPSKDTTLYAVYAYSETIGGGAPGAPVGTTMWAEDFSSYSDGDYISGSVGSATGRTIYNSGTLTYSTSDGGYNTKIYGGTKTTYAGGEKPELMIGNTNGYFNIVGIPTGRADSLTLTFKSNRATTEFNITSDTTSITLGTPSKDGYIITLGISNNGATTFNLKFAEKTSNNARVDDFSIVVSKQGIGGVTTNYFTTSPDCDCQVTITAVPNNTTYGSTTVNDITTP